MVTSNASVASRVFLLDFMLKSNAPLQKNLLAFLCWKWFYIDCSSAVTVLLAVEVINRPNTSRRLDGTSTSTSNVSGSMLNFLFSEDKERFQNNISVVLTFVFSFFNLNPFTSMF